MQDSNQPNNQNNPVDDISSDLDAIRKLDAAEPRVRWKSAFAVVLLLVTIFVSLVWIDSLKERNDLPSLYSEAVAFDENYNGGQWVGTALNQAIQATLRSGDQLHLVNAPVSVQVGDRFGARLENISAQNVQWILKAALSSIDDDVVAVQIDLTNSRKPEDSLSASIVGSKNSIADLAVRCVEQIYAWLELDRLTSEHVSLAKSEIPAPVASEAYGNGLVALADHNAKSALEHFQSALTETPNNASILEGMALAWNELGYLDKSIEASKRAFEASALLSRERQLELEARYAMATESWVRANQVFAALKEFNPNELNYRLPLSETLARQNLGDEFLASIEEMRALPGTLSEDPRIDLTEAWYWFSTGDYARCAQLANEAKEKAIRVGNRLIQGEALLNFGRCDDSYDPTVLLEAREIFRQLDIPSRESGILRELAKHEYGQGNIKEYVEYLEKAVDISEGLGNEPQVAASKNALALAYDLHGWLEKGLVLKENVAKYYLQRGNLNRYSILLENIGISLFKLGRYQQALQTIDQAEAIFLEVDDQIGVAWVPYRRGQIALRRGELDDARSFMQKAHKNAETRPEGNLALESKYELGLIHYYAGENTMARTTLEDTLSQYQKLELNLNTAENLIALARLDREEHKIARASNNLHQAESLLEKEAAYYSLSAASELTVFYADLEKDTIRQRCEHLEQLVKNQEFTEYVLRAKIKLAVCSVVNGSQSSSRALKLLDELHAQSSQLGLFDIVLASRYAQTAILQQSGETDEAQRVLDRVKKLAKEHEWPAHPLPDLAIEVSTAR